ncbi:unnamed protein product [Rhizopus microsporus]
MQHVRHKPKLNRVRETQLQPDKIMECKQELQSYRIFLYKLDFASESALSRQIKKLGAARAPFFSASQDDCTHVITTKELLHVYDTFSDTQKSPLKDTQGSLETSVDEVIKNAYNWKKTIWSAEYAKELFMHLIEYSPPKTREAQTYKRSRPAYYEFSGYFLMIEDATNTHSPIDVKEYSEDCFCPDERTDLPWPTLEPKAGERRKRLLPSEILREIENIDADQLLAKKPANDDQNEMNSQKEDNTDTTQESDTCKKTKKRKERCNKETAKEGKQKEPKGRNKYCETCGKHYTDLQTHVKSPEHIDAHKNSDFSGLDSCLSSLKRKYAYPLPSYMKTSVNPIVDGSDVLFDI